MTRLFGFVLLVITAGLTACNGVPGYEPEIPSERPFGDVSGYVVDEAIAGASIAVYAFDGGKQGELLASAVTTDAEGAYTLRLQSPDRPVLIESRGGAYTDLASGTRIDIDSDQVLRAIALYRSGEPLTLMVTPLTHIATGLAEYKAAHGATASEAVTAANADISKLFQVDIVNTRPFSINNDAATDNAGYFYGFYLAAVSSWTDWAVRRSGANPGAAFSAMELTQIIYNDIHADGLLDGIGLNSVNGQPMPLSFAGQPLGPSVYRLDLAQHMITMAAGGKNATGVTVTQLLPRAQALLGNDGELVPESTANGNGGPTLISLLAENVYYNGVLDFRVMLSESIVLKQVRFEVDGMVIGDAVDPNQPSIQINTAQFGDGDRKIKATATDMLGNSFARTFSLKFDNILPQTNFTSAKVTNQSPFTLKGQYIENGAGLRQISIGDKPVSFNAVAKTWQAEVTLQPGQNNFEVTLIDIVGNKTIAKTVISLDQTAPEFIAVAHGPARFSDGNGGSTPGTLADSNDKVFLETDKTDLNGSLIARDQLEGKKIPYFAFRVSDPTTNGVGSVANKIAVSLRIEKNGDEKAGGIALAAVNGEYLLPLATEKLYAEWLNSTPNDVIGLWVKAVDEVGNASTEKLFIFKPDFVVPVSALSVVVVTDVGGDKSAVPPKYFTSTPFDNRGSLHDWSFEAVDYTLRNNSGKSIFIGFTDVDKHSVSRAVEQMVRVHEVRKKTATEWQAAMADLVSLTEDGCPRIGEIKPVISLYNYTTGSWQQKSPPAIEYDIPYAVRQDALPDAPPANSWTPLPDDGEYYLMPNGATVDYSPSDPTQANQPQLHPAQAAMVSNWIGVDLQGNPVSCANTSIVEQRQIFAFESTVGPENQSSAFTDQASFSSEKFLVLDKNDANSFIVPFNGWYRVPAAHEVVVQRWVRTPVMAMDNDTDVGSPDFNSYIAHRYDKSIMWTIQRPLNIQMIHDAGEDNISSMTEQNNVVGSGTKSYQISR